MNEEELEVGELVVYDRPAPRRYVYCFVNAECRDMDGRLRSAMYMVGGQQWHIGPGGDEW